MLKEKQGNYKRDVCKVPLQPMLQDIPNQDYNIINKKYKFTLFYCFIKLYVILKSYIFCPICIFYYTVPQFF